MKYPYTVEDFVREHPNHSDAAKSELFSRVTDAINRAYHSGLHGEESVFATPDTRKLDALETEYLTLYTEAMQDAYLHGRSEREVSV